MKVLQVHNSYRIRGGEDVVVDRERDSLRAAGCEVVEYRESSQEITALETLKLFKDIPYSRRAKERLKEKLDEVRPDVVHLHNYFPLLTPSVIDSCVDAGVPVVHTLHNFRMFCANGLLLRDGQNCHLCLGCGASAFPGIKYGCYRNSSIASVPVVRMIERAKRRGTWAKSVAAYICSTEFTKKMFVSAGLPEEKIFLKSNFSPDLSQSYRRDNQGFALYLGRISEEKGIRTLVEAWRGSPHRLVFCGHGPLEAWVAEKGFEVVSLPQAEALGLLAKAACMLMPTECHEAGFPLVLMEALSLGVPVAVSRFGAADQYFQQGSNALIFEPGDQAGLRAAAHQLLQSRDLQDRIGASGRALYEKNFSDAGNAKELMEIYRSVIGVS